MLGNQKGVDFHKNLKSNKSGPLGKKPALAIRGGGYSQPGVWRWRKKKGQKNCREKEKHDDLAWLHRQKTNPRGKKEPHPEEKGESTPPLPPDGGGEGSLKVVKKGGVTTLREVGFGEGGRGEHETKLKGGKMFYGQRKKGEGII